MFLQLFSALKKREMPDVLEILLMLTLVGAATGSPMQDPVVCIFTESNQCYVSLGQQLHLPMPQEYGFNLKMTDKTNTDRLILKYRGSDTPKQNYSRWQFVNHNKTLILTSVERSDAGTYTLDIFDANGITKGRYSVQLYVQDFTLAILSTVSVLLIVISVLALYIYKKRRGLRNKEAPAQDGTELMYAQVTKFPKNSTETSPSNTHPAQDGTIEYQNKNEDEVQYSKLTFHTFALEKCEMPKVQDECVYSQVRQAL